MFYKTQYKLLIKAYMDKYDVSYVDATKELAWMHKIHAETEDDIINNYNISML